jgi:hypothetical protein
MRYFGFPRSRNGALLAGQSHPGWFGTQARISPYIRVFRDPDGIWGALLPGDRHRGNDKLCIDALKAEMLPKYISVETDGPGTILELLWYAGYQRFKLVNQAGWYPARYLASSESGHGN